MTELKYINKKDKKNLQINDLILLGLYTILLFILMGVGLGLCAAISSFVFGGKIYFALYTSVIAGLFCGPAFSLIFNKINKKHAVLIMNIIIALFMSLTGHSIISAVIFVIAGILGELFYRLKNEYLSYLMFCLGNIGAIIPTYFMKDNYIQHLKNKNYSQEKIDFIMQSSDLKTFILILVLTVVAALIGAYIGRKVYFKNFDKAGL